MKISAFAVCRQQTCKSVPVTDTNIVAFSYTYNELARLQDENVFTRTHIDYFFVLQTFGRLNFSFAKENTAHIKIIKTNWITRTLNVRAVDSHASINKNKYKLLNQTFISLDTGNIF